MAEPQAIKNWNYTCGSLSLSVEEGLAAYLLADGEPMGLYLKGKGSFRFLAADPGMKPTLLFNLKENTRLVPEPQGEGLVLGEPLTEVILWFAGKDVAITGEPIAKSLAKEFQALSSRFAERERAPLVWAASALQRLPLGQIMAYRTLNQLKAPVVTAELAGATEHFVFTYDTAFAKTESFFIQRPAHPTGAVGSIVLAERPIDWDRQSPLDPDFRLTHVDLDLQASRGMTARMTLVETLQVVRPNLRCLVFNFRHLRGTGRAGKLNETLIHSIRTEDGRELSFDLRGGFLEVDLGRQLRNGEQLKLTFDVSGAFLESDGGTEFDYWRLQPGTHWIPEPGPAAQGYTVKAKVAVEKPYVPIVSAKTLSRSSSATHNIVEASLDKPTLWLSVAAGKYVPVELVRHNRTVRAWCYVSVPNASEALLKTTHGILEFYDQLFGGVPFEEINLVEVPSLGFGQAPAGMIWLTREAFNPFKDTLTRFVAGGQVGGWSNRLVAHELAHQYWAHRVKIWSLADNWISESFAEYSSALAMKAMKVKGASVYEDIVKNWGELAMKAAPHGTIPTCHLMQPAFDRSSGPPEHRVYSRWLLYEKGAYLLACLHKDMGDQAFYRFLRSYQSTFAWYPPSYTQDVERLLKAASGKDYGAWMKEYFWGTGMPAWKP